MNDLDHLSPYSSKEQVIIRVDHFIERFESLVSLTSTVWPISQPLLEIGVGTFRKFTTDDFRILYRIKEEKIASQLSVVSSFHKSKIYNNV